MRESTNISAASGMPAAEAHCGEWRRRAAPAWAAGALWIGHLIWHAASGAGALRLVFPG